MNLIFFIFLHFLTATVSTIAGSVKGFRDGLGSHAMLNNPNGITFVENDKCWYFCDSSNNSIRKITASGEYLFIYIEI